MPKEEQPITVTLTIRDLIYSILGGMHDERNSEMCRPIPHEVAIVLNHKLKDSVLWKVEFEDSEGKPHSYPLLWRYPEWQTAASTYNKRKLYAEKERIVSFIRDKNVYNMARAITKNTGMREEDAKKLAYSLVKKGNEEVMKILGLGKLVTKEEEL